MYKNIMSNIEQILVVTSLKAVAVYLPTYLPSPTLSK